MKVPALKDDKTGKASYTLTAFVMGVLIVNLKLILSGIEIMDKVKMSEFTGTDYSMAMAALSALYVGNKKLNGPKKDSENKKDE